MQGVLDSVFLIPEQDISFTRFFSAVGGNHEIMGIGRYAPCSRFSDPVGFRHLDLVGNIALQFCFDGVSPAGYRVFFLAENNGWRASGLIDSDVFRQVIAVKSNDSLPGGCIEVLFDLKVQDGGVQSP